MKQTLRNVLDTYQPPAPEPSAKAALLAARRTLPGLSPAGFLWTQLGFIRPRMWAAQGILLAALAMLVYRAPGAESVYLLLGSLLPLLLVINITDLVRVYNGGMLELELATRYNLPQVCAARLLLFGLVDFALLGVAAALGAAALRAHLFTLLLYCLTPFLLMCAGCLAALRLLRPDQLLLATVLLTVATGAILTVARRPLYLPQHRPFWMGALAVALVLLVWQSLALQRKGVFSCKL